MTLRSLFLTALVIAACWYWLKSREIKELAFRAAAKKCASLGVELLDQSVVLKSIKLKRDSRGSVRLFRRYIFDFSSTGEQRYQGEIIVFGKRVHSVQLAPHRVD